MNDDFSKYLGTVDGAADKVTYPDVDLADQPRAPGASTLYVSSTRFVVLSGQPGDAAKIAAIKAGLAPPKEVAKATYPSIARTEPEASKPAP